MSLSNSLPPTSPVKRCQTTPKEYHRFLGPRRLEPWAYVREVILQLSVDASPERLTELLPDRWALTHPEHVLGHRLEESRQKARRRDQRRADRRGAK